MARKRAQWGKVKRCANRQCRRLFRPAHSNHKFCMAECRRAKASSS